MEPIRSLTNTKVVEAGRLHRTRNRRQSGKTLIEGPNALTQAVAAGIAIERTFVLETEIGSEWPSSMPVSEAVLQKVAGTENPRGPIAVAVIPPNHPVPRDRDLMVLWGVSDPGNVGTLIRSCAAFGLGVVVGPNTADPWAPKTIRASAGAHFRIPISSIDSVDELAGHRLAATVVSGGADLTQLPGGPWAVIVGEEAAGLTPGIVSACDLSVSIPMPGGGDSLNVAAAGAIIAYVLSYRSESCTGPN